MHPTKHVSSRPAVACRLSSFSRLWPILAAVATTWTAMADPPTGAPVAKAELHPFNVRDMQAMDRVGDPQISPDGKRVVFTVSSLDLEHNRRDEHLWLVDVDGKGLRRLTSSQASDGAPRWAPDGRSVWFTSHRSGSPQVWRIALDGGEAEQITRLPIGVGGFRLSPDGATLVFSLKVFPDCDGLACTEKRLEALKTRRESGQLYERLMVRHWDTWMDGRRAHLFAMPVAGGEPIDLMKGIDADCPSRPFGGIDEYAFSPDGRSVVFSARHVGREESWSTNFDLYQVPVDGSAAPKAMTADNKAWDAHPVFSPDGKTLAYLAMKHPGYEADKFDIVLRAWPEGTTRVLTSSWDRSAGDLAWAPDGKTLYATADNDGQAALFAFDTRGRSETMPRVLLSDGHASAPSPARDVVVFARDTLAAPADLYAIRPDGKGLRAITHFNAERLAAVKVGSFERWEFAGWNGEKVSAHLVKPIDFDPAKKYPVTLLVHGGPQGSFGNHFHYRWNAQNLAAAGYAVVMIDYHGSTGYGQAFTDSIQGDWGGKPLEDLKKGLEDALHRYAFLDGNRVCALGGSFGGYMMNWIEGAWPDRFRCLVNHDGNLDERMAFFDTEELWFPERDHMGTPWDNPESYEKHNPITLVKNWKTPMLVIHGGQDFRVVDTQGLSTFTALQRRGIPSKLLYFPDENHWVLKPVNNIQWYDTVIDWLNQWTR